MSTDGKCEQLLLFSSVPSVTQRDRQVSTERTNIFVLGRKQVFCCVSQTSLTVHPSLDNTPARLINTSCRNCAQACFPWDQSSGNLLIPNVCVCVHTSVSVCMFDIMEFEPEGTFSFLMQGSKPELSNRSAHLWT